jgi:hypothetical protein
VGAELVDQFVDGLSVRMERDAGEVELGCGNRRDSGAVGLVVRRSEQVVREDGEPLPLPDSTGDPLLTILGSGQLVATHGNGFRVSEPLSRSSHLPPVATGCDRSAP